MDSSRRQRTGRFRPVRIVSALGVAAALAAAPLAAPAVAASAQSSSSRPSVGEEISGFYSARDGRLLWYGAEGRQIEVLLELLESAEIDGLDPRRYRVGSIARAVRAARNGNPRAQRRAETMLSEAFVSYVRDLRRPAGTGMIYVDRELRPEPPTARAILQSAAAAPSLERYVAEMGWMHPLYGQLRYALISGRYSGGERERVGLNLERARDLPARPRRHVLVNTAAQRLFMYENGQVVDSMRVVVGKQKNPTPMMSAFIRYTALNPYWNVPPDLAAENIAPNVVKIGLKYLRDRRYQVLSDWGPEARTVDPAGIDWKAVADGRQEVRLRQLPGPLNFMGKMKFMFPNSEGVYLHDTPDKDLLSEPARTFSGGCVRLEDAARLAEWLYGRPLNPKGARAEQPVPLEDRVPVVITYLTAVPDGRYQLAFYDDIYGRDAQRLAQLRSGGATAARR